MSQYILIGIAILFVSVIILALFLNGERNKNIDREIDLRNDLKETTEILEQQFMADLAKAVLERNDKFNTMQISNENKLDELSAQLIEKMDDKLIETQNNTDTKITLLTTALEHVIEENAKLRKKLEFFTEIDEDSKNLNETEDSEAREDAIQKALKELKEIPKKSVSYPEDTSKVQMEITEEETFDDIEVSNKNDTSSYLETSALLEKDIKSDIKTPNADSILDDEQKLALSIMNNTNDNLFITGKAGTGKSFLLDVFVRGTSKTTIKLAPTGIAALNIKGATIHSAFGYNNLEKLALEDISKEKIALKEEKVRTLTHVDTIIIDEISMVRADTFDKIDKILRILNKSAKPFGGKQMIVFGDLFQLPPIAKKQEQKYLTDYYGGIFFFNSNSYNNGNFDFIELSTNHRQKDDYEFFDILNRMREGKTSDADIETLNSRYVDNKEELRRILTLFPKKADAEKLNREELGKIEAKEYVYRAKVLYNAKKNQNLNLDAIFPFSDTLRLKRGALVMLVANDPQKRWVNGTMGVVHSLTEDGINVTIDGTTYEIEKTKFTEKEVIYKDGKMEYQDVLSVEQYPVVLSYAITIHKSQGMTYKKIACDISQCFAAGQAYVALSRCSSIKGLHLLEHLDYSMMQVDEKVKNYYLSQSTEKTIEKYS